ncbi:MAG: TraR/DksA family transcriptional regulator [bacterium]|nr:TraR/DksA family transcriptional regulator [bacterium]
MVKSKKKTPAKPARSPKKNARLDELKVKLQQERDNLVSSLDSDSGRLAEMSGQGDLVDQSNDFRERELLMGMAEHDRERLMAINEALAMIDQGTYGVCAMCEEEIPEARLLAVPTAKYCVKCQSIVESKKLD